MSTTDIEESTDTSIAAGLARLATLPDWLLAPLQADRVQDELRRHVPEFASGALALSGVKIKRMLLKDGGRWVGTYSLAIAEPEGGKRTVALRGTFTPPHLGAAAAASPDTSLGAIGWRMALPQLGLELETEPAESDLPAMPALTDPDSARALLEDGIRAGAYPDIEIESCQVDVLSYKPGSRGTIRYFLAYPPALAGRGWPSAVIAKTYRKESKGRNAFEGMVTLWHTPLARGDVVALAEPLAYIPTLKVMVQGPVAGDRSLEDLLKSALDSDAPEAAAELTACMARAAAGLAAFHQSGAVHGEPVTLDERYAELRELSAKLYAAAPELCGAADPVLARLEALAGQAPADAPVPTHGTFNPEQVLIDGERVGFIDFDDFCMAEPALDVGLFRAAIKDIGMNALDAICDEFLAAYERHAPISRERVALWEAWSYFRDALHYWIKVKPAEPDNGMLMLRHHLRGMDIV